MSNDFNESLEKMEAMADAIYSGSTMTPDEKEWMDRRKEAPSIFMTDIRFKESMDSGEFISEDAYSNLDDDKKGEYEMITAVDEKTGEPMGWVFRFKGSMTPDTEEVPEDDEDEMMAEKAASLLEKMMSSMDKPSEDEVPSMSMTDARFKEMMSSGELVSDEDYKMMDEDAKGSFEAVNVIDEMSGKGRGKCWRRRSPLEVMARRKSEKADGSEDMFETMEEAAERAAVLGCRGTHRAGGMYMPCATHEEFMDLRKPAEEVAAPAPAAPSGGAASMGGAPGQMAQADVMKSAEPFLCGFQRKSVTSSCEFCTGGCKSVDGLPNLGDIENQIKSAYSGAEIVSSGYSAADDVFVVDVKRSDGSFIEVFLNGYGEELGWLRLDERAINTKTAEAVNIISKSEAEMTAVKTINGLGFEAEVMSVMVDIFADEDVYVVELDADEKSYDVFVAADGKVLGYDEYEYEPESLEEERKALEAEMELKRMYSREQREAMADSGEAMEDGSFPIADEADLSNAIQAVGRAKDIDAAKQHIMKRAKELKLEDMLPEEWSSPASPAEGEKSDLSDILADMDEFTNLMKDLDLS